MTGRTRADVVAAVRAMFQRLLSTATTSNQTIIADRDLAERTVKPPYQGLISLRHPQITGLWFRHHIALFETGERGGRRWRAQTSGYVYGLYDSAGRELIAFHWHPDVPGRPDPHIHLGAASGAVGLLRESHIPSGRIALEDVLLYGIRELGIESPREDWEAILTESLAAFREERSWA